MQCLYCHCLIMLLLPFCYECLLFNFCQESSKQYTGDAQHFSQNRMSDEKPKFVDASQLFRNPHRTSRPDHFVIILRGFPGVCFSLLYY
jgi:hypothetical protein